MNRSTVIILSVVAGGLGVGAHIPTAAAPASPQPSTHTLVQRAAACASSATSVTTVLWKSEEPARIELRYPRQPSRPTVSVPSDPRNEKRGASTSSTAASSQRFQRSS